MRNQSGEGFKGYISTYRILYREIIVHIDNIIIGGKGLGIHKSSSQGLRLQSALFSGIVNHAARLSEGLSQATLAMIRARGTGTIPSIATIRRRSKLC